MIKFTKDYVLLLQKVMLEATGGEVEVRDVGLLESALESAYVTFDGSIVSVQRRKGGKNRIWIS